MGTIQIDGSTPKLTIGNATAEDALILFDGNAQDFHIGLDDTADDLVIGVGSALGTTTALAIDENAGSTFSGTITVGVDDTGHDVKFFGATASSYMLWDESADDLNLIASGLGVGTAKDLGVGIHIKTADSGASANSNADELVIEGSANSGMNILSGNTSAGRIYFGDDGDDDIGQIRYNHDDNSMNFKVNALADSLKIDSSRKLSTGGESAPDVDAGGITLNQGGDDGFIMSFKSSDIAHGVTTDAETDTFGIIKKGDGAVGGIKIRGFSEGENAINIVATYTTDNTNHSTGASAPLSFDARKKSGTDDGAAGADANLLRVTNGGSPKFIIDEDGDIFYDGSASAFDTYDDAQLVRAMDMVKSPEGVIASKFDKFLKYNKKDLKKSGVLDNISEEEEAEGQVPFVCITKLQKLHNGAIWQQYEKHQQLLEAVYDLAKEAVGEEKANAILDKHEVKRLQ
jgi:hypothetical protein